jgi:serine/threonine-protein kinase
VAAHYGVSTPTDRLNAALAGRYRIDRHLGEGGMASVYLAEDLKHDRKVALKLLKPELAAVLGAERFVQEIKTTASLQHPHILPLFDSGSADGFLYYVMPFIDGETLRDRLNRETQLGVGESVQIAREVADALDYAHRHGVIHRDIKPENILLNDGRALVADFGIALAVSAAAGGRMTETGLSLGTPHYMSPEQATADKDINGRSDVYSLGSVLYEMLTGSPPHTGANAQQIIMKIITAPAESVTAYRKTVPRNVADAVAKALEKLPADRFESAKAFSAALADPLFTTAGRPGTVWVGSAAGVSRSAIITVSAAMVGLAAVALWGWLRPQQEPGVLRYQLDIPSIDVTGLDAPMPVPSPDGSFIVYPGSQPGSRIGSQLYMKQRSSVSATPIAGTAGAQAFAISPDNTWIAFGYGTVLKKVQISGGVPVDLATGVDGSLGIAWLDDGTLVFSQTTRGLPVIASVPAAGGETKVLWKSDSAGGALATSIRGTHGILFGACSSFTICDTWAMNVQTREAHRVLPGIMWARYAEPGYIVYEQGGRLSAIGFDPTSLTTRGQPIPLADMATGLFPFELSRSGTLITRTATNTIGNSYDMVWVDRAGRVTPIDTTWHFRVAAYANDHGWALSPDGTKLAIGLQTDAGDDIWVKELPRGPLSRVTFDAGSEVRPRWTRDSRSVTFFSAGGVSGIHQRRADGAGSDTLLLAGQIDEAVTTLDGSWLLFRIGARGSVAGGRDIRGIRLGGDTAQVKVVVTPFDEEAITPSPDGKWLAYQSDETGRTEVFIRSFPNTEGFKRQVSNGGGAAPLWARDGRELFYLGQDKTMMVVRLTGGSPITISQPATLFRVHDDLLSVEYEFYTPWDVTADGRFIMARARRVTDRVVTPIVVAENWFSELKARTRR